MKNFNDILENQQLNAWVQHFRHAPHQLNYPHEADAELLAINGNSGQLLAITTDTVAEEMLAGLYREPFTMGWVTIMAALSDLAAVGANPLGLLTAISIEPDRDSEFIRGIAEGMAAACEQCETYILGGDSTTSPTLSLTGCALGMVPRQHLLTRLGCQAEDIVFLSGKAGSGSALGLARYANIPETLFNESMYRPVARLKQGQMIRKYASCCMDTSDGVFTTLDQLMRLNELGFVIEAEAKDYLDSSILRLAQIAQVPDWAFLAGYHGEFELIFTIAPAKVEQFLTEATQSDWTPIQLGRVIEKSLIQIKQRHQHIPVDTGKIRNLFVEVQGNPQRYLQELLQLFK